MRPSPAFLTLSRHLKDLTNRSSWKLLATGAAAIAWTVACPSLEAETVSEEETLEDGIREEVKPNPTEQGPKAQERPENPNRPDRPSLGPPDWAQNPLRDQLETIQDERRKILEELKEADQETRAQILQAMREQQAEAIADLRDAARAIQNERRERIESRRGR